MKLIKLHERWVKKGMLPEFGLCGSIPSEYVNTLGLFMPTKDDFKELRKNGLSGAFWGSGLPFSDDGICRCFSYTPLRQTIVLLICAMHDEI